jgi:SAM-dependent methyltransferase
MTARCDSRMTSAAYSLGADAYDDTWSPVILPPAEAVVGRLNLAPAQRVLDVGAGTGALTPAVRAAAPHATILSIDPAAEMLHYAQRHRHVVPVLADAAALPIRDESADAVLLAYVLFMLPEPADGLREATRVLRPGGRAGTVTWASEEPSIAAKMWDATLDELGIEPVPAHSNHAGLDTSDAIATRLRDATLVPDDVWHETITFTFEPEDFWRLRTAHGSNGVRLARLDPARRAVALSELRNGLSLLGPSDYEFRGKLVCSVSTKPNNGGRR